MSPAVKTDPVLRRFRAKFIVVTMSFVAVLLLGVLVVASVFTYSQHVDDVNAALDMRTERMSQMPAEMLIDNLQAIREYGFDLEFEFGDEREGGPLSGGGRNRGEQRYAGDDPVVATSAYLLDDDGDIQVVVSNALSLDSSTVEEAMDDIIDNLQLDDGGSAHGRIGTLNLFYKIKALANGYSVALASGNYVDRSMVSLISTLALLETFAFLVFLVACVLISRWVVGPVERTWKQQRQFVADASHELKTPLAVIRANDSLLMANPDASVASQMQWIESTEIEANLMQDLVNDMLYLAQSENTQNEVVFTKVSLTEIVQSSVLQFESVAFERGVLLESDIADDVAVNGEAKALSRLVGTLIDNACKYAEDGGRVNVRLWKQGNTASLRVHNTGPAIPADDLPHLFDRFYRSDKARTHGTGGFGLGLSIAKTIVDEHKGIVTVASKDPDGTVFTVSLPAG